MNFIDDMLKGWTHLWGPHEHVINELGTSYWAPPLKDAIPQYCHLGTKPLKHEDL